MKFHFRFLGIALLLFSNKVRAQEYLTFREALQMAKQKNPLLKVEYKNLDLAAYDVVTAKLRPNPTFNNQSLQQVDSRYFSPNSTWSENTNRQVWYQLTKPMQLGGLRSKRVDYAQQNSVVSEKTYLEAEREVLSQVAHQWVNVWHATVEMNAIKGVLNSIDSLTAVNAGRLKKGTIRQAELIRTRLLAEQYRLRYFEFQGEFQSEINKLKVQIGISDSLVIVDRSFETPVFPTNIDSIFSLAMRQRPDVQLVRAKGVLADKNIDVQKARAIPQPELGVIWNPQNSMPYLGFYGTIQLPFFSRNQGEIGKSKVVKDQNILNLSRIELTVKAEIATAYSLFKLYQGSLQRYDSILTDSDFVLNLSRKDYLGGLIDLTDYLEIQRSWLETRQVYFTALYNYRKSCIDMMVVTGTID